MGLTSWKGESVRKSDINVAKNYLNESEISERQRRGWPAKGGRRQPPSIECDGTPECDGASSWRTEKIHS